MYAYREDLNPELLQKIYDYSVNDPNPTADNVQTIIEDYYSTYELTSGNQLKNMPKYSQYTQPGGEDYTELVFSLDPDYNIPSFSDVNLSSEQIDELLEEVSRRYDFLQGGQGTEQEIIDYVGEYASLPPNRAKALYDDIIDGGTRRPYTSFQSGHWDDNNVVAHTRFDTRYTEDGRKVLFIDEIQSDWHQAGRDKGYVGDTIDLDDWKIEGGPKLPNEPGYADIYLMVNSKNERISVTASSNEKAYLKLAERLKKDRISDAPFRNTWDEYVQKRLLRYAADNGYDGIAWSTGRQQANRWQQAVTDNIDTIQYNQDSQWLRAYKDNEEILSQRIPKEELSETVGADVARKLLDTTPDTFTIRPLEGIPSNDSVTDWVVNTMPDGMDPVEMLRWMDGDSDYQAWTNTPAGYQVVDQNGNAWGYTYPSEEAAQKAIHDLQVMEETMKTVSGANVTIGGEGMRKFYDQQVPSNFKKLGKKFGLSIDEITIGSGPFDMKSWADEFELDSDTWETVASLVAKDGITNEGVSNRIAQIVNNQGEFRNGIGKEELDYLVNRYISSIDDIIEDEGLDIVSLNANTIYDNVEKKLKAPIKIENSLQGGLSNPMNQQGIWLDPKSRQAITQQSFPLYAKQDAQGPVDNLTAGWSDRQITALDNFLKWRNSVVKQYRQLGIPINELEKYVPFIPKKST